MQDLDYYYLAPGVDVVPLDDGNVLFRSDALAVRLEGKSAQFFVEQVLPLLDGQRSFPEVVAELPELSSEDLRSYLEALVKAQILCHTPAPQVPQPADELILSPFLAMLESLGRPKSAVLQSLRQMRVAVIGLEGHGAHVAAMLADTGIGTVVLADPYPCQPGNIALMPLVGRDAIGTPRDDALKAALQARETTAEIIVGGDREVTRDGIAALARDCHMLVGCFDKGFSSTNHWINQVSLEQRIPALYAESRGHIGMVGPLVLPGQTACFMCYRMRSVACADNFDETMTYEEFLDQQKRPALQSRGVLPPVLSYMASVLVLEILKCLLALGQPSLAGTVLEFDALSLRARTHTVLQKPDCPICQGKKKRIGPPPSLPDLRQSSSPPGDLGSVAHLLVSERTGVVKTLELVQKDLTEPTQPYIFGAWLANHRFLAREVELDAACSGKGMTPEKARVSALGEAVERYSGACWDHSEVWYACRNDIDGQALDPRKLVLYAPEQYSDLPYVPYEDTNVLGWVPARSLVTGNEVFVPALTAFMNYEARHPEERICQVTSNGLAAGATLPSAILGAALEVIERDAFMIAWLNRLPCERVDLWNHPDADIVDLCTAHLRRGLEMRLYALPTDFPCHVFAAICLQTNSSDGPAVVVGLGADLAADQAARQAIVEVAQVRPALRRRMRDPETKQRIEELVADPHLVAELEDHDLLYSHKGSLGAFAFLFDRPAVVQAWEPSVPEKQIDGIQRLADHCHSMGSDLLYCDLTPPDMLALGLHTVRAIIPNCQPIHFGWKERRLGGDRLYDLPRHLKIASSRTTIEQLNPDPHPLA